ncbi:MAG: hypothetical protein QM727_14020 [Niabella sp.]
MRKLIYPALIAVVFSSCATVFSGSKQTFTIHSDPDSANVTIVNNLTGREVFSGKTPTEVKLRRSSGYFQPAEYIVNISSEGHETKSIPVKFNINGWYWGNILIGGAIGMVGVDPGTGAMFHSKQEKINETLTKK